MARILILVSVFFLAAIVLSPLAVSAQADSAFVTCSGPDCQACHLVEMADNIIQFLIVVLTVVAALIFAYAGFVLVTSAGDVTAKESAKTMFTNVIIGYIIVLASWLIIDTGMKALLDDEIESSYGPWNKIDCVEQPGVESRAITFDDSPWIDYGNYENPNAPRIRTSDSAGGVVSGGSCDVITDPDNPCSPENMQGTCFADRAEDASRICNLESAGGRADVMSGTDLCSDGKSFSGGLWQINLLVHADKVPGCNLSNQGQGSCLDERTNSNGLEYCAVWDCSFAGQEAEYNQCVAALQDPDINTQIACQLYDSGGFQPWQNSANECDVSY